MTVFTILCVPTVFLHGSLCLITMPFMPTDVLLCSCGACVLCELLCVYAYAAEYISSHFNFFSICIVTEWVSECVCLSLNQPPSHTHKLMYTYPTQASLPPKAELLSFFFHHTAPEVSPAISGTSCSPTAPAPPLRAQGNTATPKHPAAPPMTSGSLAPKVAW